MNLDEIRQILDMVREHDLAEFELEQDGLKVRVRKAGREIAIMPPAMPVAAVAMPAASPAPPAGAPPAGASPHGGGVALVGVKSAVVGKVYRSAEPGAAPFVQVGDSVKKGQ